jgi:hypothetical protein
MSLEAGGVFWYKKIGEKSRDTVSVGQKFRCVSVRCRHKLTEMGLLNILLLFCLTQVDAILFAKKIQISTLT